MNERVPRQLFCNPLRGLPLCDALIYYNRNYGPLSQHFQSMVFKYQQLLETSLLPKSHKEHLTHDQSIDLTLHELILTEFLCREIYDGSLIAKGYITPGQMYRILIPAEWWTRVRFNLIGNWAEAHGTRVLDVHVWPNPETESSSVLVGSENAKPTAAPSAVAKLDAWYRDRAAAWRPGMPILSLEADRHAAKQTFGKEHRAEVKLLRQKYAPAEWRIGRAGRKPAAN